MANIDITWDVKPIAQTKDMSCWAAAAAMLLSWKNGIPMAELDVAQLAGDVYVVAFTTDQGLPGTAVGEFAVALGCVTEAPQNFTPDAYARLLQGHGPLWIGTAMFYPTTYRHVRVVRGLFGDGTFDGTQATIVDPSGGREYQISLAELGAELEQIAKDDLAEGSNLNPQVIRLP